ncbi:MAG: hypothetical protein AAF567_00280 [Actinomycetota bacterium]
MQSGGSIRVRLGSAVLAIAIGSAACGGGTDAPPQADEFLEITDCRELERLASVEVDRINSSTDRDIIDAATARFQRIVAHRDATC